MANHINIKRLMTFILLGGLILISCNSSDKIPEVQWQKSFGGTNGESANIIEQTKDGGFVFAGYTGSIDGDVTGNDYVKYGRSTDYWIVKTDKKGNIEWQKALGGSEGEDLTGMCVTSDNGYIVIGVARSTDGYVDKNHKFRYCWVVKLDKKGEIQWQKSINAEGNDVHQTSDGGFVIVGTPGISSFGGKNDFYIAKLDKDGNIQWQKEYGGTSGDVAQSVRQTTDGGYIVAGYTSSVDGDVKRNKNTKKSEEDYWIIKLSKDGTLEWQKTYGGSEEDKANAVRQTKDGGYIVAGFTRSYDGDVNSRSQDTVRNRRADYWIVKLDNKGEMQWEKNYGGIYLDEAKSIQQAQDGGYIIAGKSNSEDRDITFSYGDKTDYWIVKIDKKGTLQWQKTLGGSGVDEAYDVKQTKDGGYIVAGYSDSKNGDVRSPKGGGDAWIVKLK